MQKVIRLLIVLSFLLSLAVEADTKVADTKVYKTVDKQGNVIFTDQPQKGAEVIELHPLSTFEGDAVADAREQRVKASSTTPASPKKYTSLSIIQPQPNESIWLGAGDLVTKVDLMPPLSDGDKIQILLDGTLINESGMDTTFRHTNVNRGEHSVQAQVLDTHGNILISSNPVTFNMHRSSAKQRGG